MNDPFPSDYEKFIYVSRYARWVEEEKRRETWDETVSRLVNYYCEQQPIEEVRREIWDAIYNLDVMPSMRALMTAGPALDRCNVAAYNCAYLPVDSPRSFDECMYILMCGTGVGYSVEKQYVDQLPRISEQFEATETVVRVADSKEGWAKALREIISLLIAGQVPKWDLSALRPAGSRLRTFGGRASGPEPLEDLFRFSVDTFKNAAGRRLTSLEVHDLMCKIGDVVVVGGVRRSAMISLSDVTDDRMRAAKSGEWYKNFGYRRLANNSAVYEHRKPDTELFMREWKALYDSKSGERGFFSRYACQHIVARNGRRDSSYEFGTNPCSEIILRPFQFCNLSEVVVRSTDSFESLSNKVRIATILGTIQSTFTNFKYLRKIWSDNCNEERLLGVSLTGICDNVPELMGKGVLEKLRQVAIQANVEWADRLGLPRSAAITCVKPSGTVSQLVNSSSGLHSRFAPYYIRTVRADNKDPLTQFLKDQGVPHEPDVMNAGNTTVFSFPIESPKEAIIRDSQTAIQALDLWSHLQTYWCEHKPSATINVRDDEWMDVGAWVFKNFDTLSGVSFLPHDGGSYRQAPYQEITEEEYKQWKANMPNQINWNELTKYEKEDATTGAQEFACVAGVCEIVTIGSVEDG